MEDLNPLKASLCFQRICYCGGYLGTLRKVCAKSRLQTANEFDIIKQIAKYVEEEQ